MSLIAARFPMESSLYIALEFCLPCVGVFLLQMGLFLPFMDLYKRFIITAFERVS